MAAEAAVESGAARRPREDPEMCTESFFAARHSPDRRSENVGGVVPQTFELFAGSCKLSKCLKLHGFSAVGIDHKKCKNRVGPRIVLDLSKPNSVDYLKGKIDQGGVFFIPMAPPCGTASRARDKPVPKWLQRRCVPSPPPLRSAEYPSGLPGLRGVHLERVELANACYDTASQVFIAGHERGIFVFIENPKNSYMWMVPSIAKLFNIAGVFFTCFHACMHGGSRDKQTALLHNCEELCKLGVKCDGSHTHKPWGISKSLAGGWKFDTSTEAEYPLVFCQRVAVIMSRLAHARGYNTIQTEPRASPLVAQASNQWKIAAGKQPRGRRAVPMLPEDGQQVEVVVTDPGELQLVERWRGRSDRQYHLAGRIFPYGTRLLHQVPSQPGGESGDGENIQAKIVTLGIPMTPEEAVRRARDLKHPFDTAFQVQDHMLDAMFQVMTKGSEAVHQERVERLRWMKARAKQLEEKEAALHASLEVKVAEVLNPKRLLLFEELLKIVGYGDRHLVEDMCKGMSITGEGRVTGCFAPEFKPPMLDKEDLWKGAKSAQQEVRNKVTHVARRRVDVAGEAVDIAEEVWEATLKEVKFGWLEGPLEVSQVNERVGPSWTPSRRFGIVQGSKVRNIDDLSEFSINQRYGPGEKLDLGGVDEVVSLTAAWMKVGGGDQDQVRVQLSSGLVLEGEKAPEFRGVLLKLQGRCLDLKSAYKQLALSPSDRSNAVIAVLDPKSRRPIPGGHGGGDEDFGVGNRGGSQKETASLDKVRGARGGDRPRASE